MEEVELYSENHFPQKQDAVSFLKRYCHFIQFLTKDPNIIDIGCGEGDVTTEILAPFLPEKTQLTGVDVLETTIDKARQKSRDGISFQVLDISGEIPDYYKNFFHHAFSFYCLHWMQNTRKAVENVAKMLKEKGSFFATIIGRNAVYDVWKAMGESIKWKKYLYEYNNFTSPFHYSATPEKELNQILISSGFNVTVCKEEKRIWVTDEESAKKTHLAMDPFLSRIPEHFRDEYFADFWKIYLEQPKVLLENGRITVKYQVLIVLGTKM